MRTDSLADRHASAEAELKVVEKRLQRERLARREGDEIAERTTRVLYDKQQELVLLEAVVASSNDSSTVESALAGASVPSAHTHPGPWDTHMCVSPPLRTWCRCRAGTSSSRIGSRPFAA